MEKKSDLLKQAQREYGDALGKREDLRSEAQEAQRGVNERLFALANNILANFNKETGVIHPTLTAGDLCYQILDMKDKVAEFQQKANAVQLPSEITPEEINKAMDEEQATESIAKRKSKKKGIKKP